jgi:hypothetical protein
MTTTANLEAEKWTANQSSPDVTVNETFDVFDAAITGTLTFDMASDANYTLATTGSKPQEWMYGKIEITDTGVLLTAARDIIVPTNEKHYDFLNSTAQDLTIKTSAGTGILTPPGATVNVRCDGTNVIDNGGFQFTGSLFKGYTEALAQASTTGQTSLSCASANVFDVTLTANTSILFTDVPSIGSTVFTTTLFVTQDGGGTNTLNIANAIYASGKASTVSPSANDKDMWVFTTKDAGETWYGMAAGLRFT